MKIRNGFVSNSSSSSFIVGFEQVPTSYEEVLAILFPGSTGEEPVNYYGESEGFTVGDVARQVWKDLQNDAKPLDSEKARVSVVRSGWFEGYPDFPDYENDASREDRQKVWADFDKEVDMAAQACWDRVKFKFGGKQLFEFHYSDNDGSFGGIMEHGGTFDNVTSLQISHH